MSRNTFTLSEELNNYILSVSLRENNILKQLREETASHEMSNMQIAPEQGQFMSLLVKLIGARRTLEIGVFTGYSSLWTALALPEDGKIVACDINDEWTSIAKKYWKLAGVDNKIDLHLAPANETLQKLIHNGEKDTYDFAFIDADKTEYEEYFENCLQLIRPGGLIAIDNVLRHGDIINQSSDDDRTIATRKFNDKLSNDERIDLSLIPIADGLTLIRKI